MIQPELKKEELDEWRLHPVTQQLKARFAEDLQRLKDAWAMGEFENSPTLDAKARGHCEVLMQFLALETDDLATEG